MVEIPFPVDGRYRIRADIAPLGPPRGRETGHCRADAAGAAYAAAKLNALGAGATLLRGRTPGPADGTAAAIEALLRAAVVELPGRIELDGATLRLPLLGVELDRGTAPLTARVVRPTRAACDPALQQRALEWLLAQTDENRLLDTIALALQEDFAVLHSPDPDAEDAIELLHVCFPAGWTPASKLGLPFDAVHAPVPDNEALRTAHRGLVQMMIERGPFVRYVWGLHRGPDLCAAPELVSHDDDVDPNDADAVAAATWYRTERQTLLPVPAVRRAVFTIRTWTAPLPEVVTTPARAALVAASLRDMSDAVAVYKGVSERRAALLRWLDARSDRPVSPFP